MIAPPVIALQCLAVLGDSDLHARPPAAITL
jgi:hypothetical protein